MTREEPPGERKRVMLLPTPTFFPLHPELAVERGEEEGRGDVAQKSMCELIVLRRIDNHCRSRPHLYTLYVVAVAVVAVSSIMRSSYCGSYAILSPRALVPTRATPFFILTPPFPPLACCSILGCFFFFSFGVPVFFFLFPSFFILVPFSFLVLLVGRVVACLFYFLFFFLSTSSLWSFIPFPPPPSLFLFFSHPSSVNIYHPSHRHHLHVHELVVVKTPQDTQGRVSRLAATLKAEQDKTQSHDCPLLPHLFLFPHTHIYAHSPWHQKTRSPRRLPLTWLVRDILVVHIFLGAFCCCLVWRLFLGSASLQTKTSAQMPNQDPQKIIANNTLLTFFVLLVLLQQPAVVLA